MGRSVAAAAAVAAVGRIKRCTYNYIISLHMIIAIQIHNLHFFKALRCKFQLFLSSFVFLGIGILSIMLIVPF